jgi:GT2 family glycosyltransferase
MSSAARAPQVTVAVVSYETRELLLECLRSLAPEVRAGRAEVVVVDNGSHDGSVAAAREEAPWARLLEPGENLGFGRAVNLAAQTGAGAPWLACANADVALAPGSLETLLRAGEADPRVGCVAPRLVLADGTTQHSVYPLPTLGFTLAFNLGLPALSGRLADRLCLEGAWDPERARSVPWAIGAFLLLRRQAFEAVGGFDERQWVYGEDLDLGWRLREAGWVTRYEPRAHVRHAGGAAAEPAFGATRRARFTAETYRVIGWRRGRATAVASASLSVLGAAARLAWMAPLAVVLRRWRGPRTETARWFSAHLQALRSLLDAGRKG